MSAGLVVVLASLRKWLRWGQGYVARRAQSVTVDRLACRLRRSARLGDLAKVAGRIGIEASLGGETQGKPLSGDDMQKGLHDG